MGMSASASLFYGIDLGECYLEEFLENDDEEDEEDQDEYEDEDGPVELLNKKLEQFGVIIENYANYDSPLYGIMIEESQMGASWDRPVQVESLETKPEWIEGIKKACEMLGIDFKEPAWLLTCTFC